MGEMQRIVYEKIYKRKTKFKENSSSTYEDRYLRYERVAYRAKVKEDSNAR